MQLKKILVPTDFSDYSSAAIQWAASLARDHNALLMFVHVRENAGGVGEATSGVSRDRAYLHRLLQQTAQTAIGTESSQHLLDGDPGEQIVRFAAEHQADLIVLGTHGRRGLVRLLMGSVTELVLRRANCPVLTVKQHVTTQ